MDLAYTRFRIHSVFKNFHPGERIQKVADLYAGFTGCVRTETASGKKKLRIQQYPDTCGRDLIRRRFIKIKSLHVMYYPQFDRLVGL